MYVMTVQSPQKNGNSHPIKLSCCQRNVCEMVERTYISVEVIINQLVIQHTNSLQSETAHNTTAVHAALFMSPVWLQFSVLPIYDGALGWWADRVRLVCRTNTPTPTPTSIYQAKHKIKQNESNMRHGDKYKKRRTSVDNVYPFPRNPLCHFVVM